MVKTLLRACGLTLLLIVACCSDGGSGAFVWGPNDAWCRRPSDDPSTAVRIAGDQVAAIKDSARSQAIELLLDASWRKLSDRELAEFAARPLTPKSSSVAVLLRCVAWREVDLEAEREHLIAQDISVSWANGRVVVTHSTSRSRPEHDMRMRREPVVALLPGEPTDVHVDPMTVIQDLSWK